MAPVLELETKYHALSRRVESLPTELDTWVKWTATGSTLEKNWSQIETLDYFMRILCRLNEQSASTLNPAGDADVFLSDALDLTANMIKSYIVWDFFRDRLELRFVPHLQRSLLMADLVSHDCYTTIIDRAKALQINPKQGFREYPLIGLISGFSPTTWPRGRRPTALQNHKLPVPVIDLPWDHLANPWALLTIAHEVGHDVDEDLGKVTRALQPTIANRLREVEVPLWRIFQWQNWKGEILADLVGILLVGPVFVSELARLLTLPRLHVRCGSYTDAHPPHYLRVLINTTALRRLRLTQPAVTVEASWKELYGEPGDDFVPYLSDIELVISAILDTPLAALQDRDGQCHSLSELVSFAPSDQTLIQEAAHRLIAGALPDKLPIRHLVGASQLAFEQAIRMGDFALLDVLAEHSRQAIINLASPGQLPAGLASRRARRHLDNLAHELLECPMDDFDIH